MLPLNIAAAVLTYATNGTVEQWWDYAWKVFTVMFAGKLADILRAVIIMAAEYKRCKKLKWWQYIYVCLSFPIFGWIGDIATWIALFTKVTWKPIPHKSPIKIEDIEKSV